MPYADFEDAARRAFAGVVAEHRMEPAESYVSSRYAVDVAWNNDVAWLSVEAHYLERDRFFTVRVGARAADETPTRPDNGTSYPLWAIMKSRGFTPPPFTFATGAVLEDELSAWAAACQEHAQLPLDGDFSGLKGLEAFMRAHTEERMARARAMVQEAMARRQKPG
jgi:hypothetical protein